MNKCKNFKKKSKLRFVKMAIFETSKSAKLDFTENLSGRKIAKFPHYYCVLRNCHFHFYFFFVLTLIHELIKFSILFTFYSGCVIAEIRDHRNNSETTNDSILNHHVLLRPSTQSIICDGNLICERSNLHSKEDRIHVESQLCLATQGPLCLDPDPVVSIIARYSS